jgi:hypothetical protein
MAEVCPSVLTSGDVDKVLSNRKYHLSDYTSENFAYILCFCSAAFCIIESILPCLRFIKHRKKNFYLQLYFIAASTVIPCDYCICYHACMGNIYSVLFFFFQWLYSPLLGPGLIFQFLNLFTQTVGLLGRVINPSQGL